MKESLTRRDVVSAVVSAAIGAASIHQSQVHIDEVQRLRLEIERLGRVVASLSEVKKSK
jgi:hypothetical protein